MNLFLQIKSFLQISSYDISDVNGEHRLSGPGAETSVPAGTYWEKWYTSSSIGHIQIDTLFGFNIQRSSSEYHPMCRWIALLKYCSYVAEF